MIVINLFGAPNSGKTGTSAGLFGKLKRHGYEVDYVQEPVRMAHYAKNESLLKDELMLFSMKNHSIQTLIDGGVQVAIMDGPLLNSLVYCQESYYDYFAPLVKEVHDSYRNINLFLPGVRSGYSAIGRGEANPEEAGQRGSAVERMLIETKQHFHVIDPGDRIHDDDIDLSDLAFESVVLPELKMMLRKVSP